MQTNIYPDKLIPRYSKQRKYLSGQPEKQEKRTRRSLRWNALHQSHPQVIISLSNFLFLRQKLHTCSLAPSSASINASENHPSSPSTSSMHPPPSRKSNHKDAEQKRRDSLKTTFDELRVLLPRIPLPSTSQSGNPGEGEDGGGSGASGSNVGGGTSAENSFFGNVVNPLLPGALPPRGPPKAGGEGPNKSVSKLQLLICGNEYIKTLKGRVERRDDEIVRLRKEVKKLRRFLGLGGNQGGDGMESGGESGGSSLVGDELGEPYAMNVASLLEHLDLELDLDKDIDEVETMASGTMETAGGGYRDDNIMTTAGSHITIEEDDEEDY